MMRNKKKCIVWFFFLNEQVRVKLFSLFLFLQTIDPTLLHPSITKTKKKTLALISKKY